MKEKGFKCAASDHEREMERETRTLGVLCGDEGLDECVGGLCIKGEGVTK